MSWGRGRAVTRCNQRIGHDVGDFLQFGGVDGVAAVPGKTGALGVMLPGRIEADDLAVLDHLQAAADMHPKAQTSAGLTGLPASGKFSIARTV